MIAAKAVGMFDNIKDDMEKCVVNEAPILPGHERSEIYSRIFREYEEIHDALAPIYARRSPARPLQHGRRDAS